MAVTYLLIVIFMAVLGIVFLCGKGAMLIAGYNTSSPEERAQMDEKQLCRFMGKFCFAMAGGLADCRSRCPTETGKPACRGNRPVLRYRYCRVDLCQHWQPV